MERLSEHRDEAIVDLGAVSVETKGPGGGQGDDFLQQQNGISDD